MKKWLGFFCLVFSINASADIFGGGQYIKIFKNYPYDMHKTDFLKKFSWFGACEMSSDKICAPSGIESLYGIKFDINIELEKNRTKSITLYAKPQVNGIINKETYLEFFRGIVRSGFYLYEAENKDKKEKINNVDDTLAQLAQGVKPNKERFDALLDSFVDSKDYTSLDMRFVEYETLTKVLNSGGKFSSFQQIFQKLPVQTRFITLQATNMGHNSFLIKMLIELPKMNVSQVSDGPVEKF